MQIRQIKSLNEIVDHNVLEIVRTIGHDEILLMFTNGTYSIIKSNYNGIIYNIKNNQSVSHIPIDTNWRPISIGIHLYNSEVKYCRSVLYWDLDYIDWFYVNE